jgi:hypothetical protein
MRRLALILVGLVALASATGCGTAAGTGAGNTPPAPAAAATSAAAVPVEDHRNVEDYSSMDTQYRQIQVGLNLPAGVTFPAHLPDTAGRYATEAGIVAAQNFWLCAWLWAYVDGTPTGQRAEAVHELPKYARMDAYTKALDASGRAAVDGTIQAVRKGSTNAVGSFARASCGGPFYGQSHRPP